MAKKLLVSKEFTLASGANAIDLATMLGDTDGSRRGAGALDVIVYAEADNTGAVSLVGDDTATVGAPRPAGSTVVLAGHAIADDTLYARGTTDDVITVSIYGIPNPSTWS